MARETRSVTIKVLKVLINNVLLAEEEALLAEEEALVLDIVLLSIKIKYQLDITMGKVL